VLGIDEKVTLAALEPRTWLSIRVYVLAI
jgi:hypothetical protein